MRLLNEGKEDLIPEQETGYLAVPPQSKGSSVISVVNVSMATQTKDDSTTWYIQYKTSTPVGQTRSLHEIKRDFWREFQMPKSK